MRTTTVARCAQSRVQRCILVAAVLAAGACVERKAAQVVTTDQCLGGDSLVVTDSTIGDIELGMRPESMPEGCLVVSDSVRWNREHTDRGRIVEVRVGSTLVEAAVSGQGVITQLETTDPRVRLPAGVGVGVTVHDALVAGYTDGDAYEASIRLTRPSSCSPVLWVDGNQSETGELLDSTRLREEHGAARIVRIGMRRCRP